MNSIVRHIFNEKIIKKWPINSTHHVLFPKKSQIFRLKKKKTKKRKTCVCASQRHSTHLFSWVCASQTHFYSFIQLTKAPPVHKLKTPTNIFLLNPTIVQIWKAIYIQNTLAQCTFLTLKPKRDNVARCQAYQQRMSRGTLLISSLSMRSVLTLSWAVTIRVSCSDSSECSVLFWWWHPKNKNQKT